MKISLRFSITIVFFSTLTGCSSIWGPAPHGLSYTATVEDINSSAKKDWTAFETIEMAQQRLRGMSYILHYQARDTESIRHLASDAGMTALVASAIGAAKGDISLARRGAGVAGLIGLGEDRYQYMIQRSNMMSAAKAYQCAYDAISGLNSDDLRIPFQPSQNADEEQTAKNLKESIQLEEVRNGAVEMVASTAFKIRAAFEDAQTRVEIKRPDVDKIRQAVTQENERALQTGSVQQNALGAAGGVAALRGYVFDNLLLELKLAPIDAGNVISTYSKLQIVKTENDVELKSAKQWLILLKDELKSASQKVKEAKEALESIPRNGKATTARAAAEAALTARLLDENRALAVEQTVTQRIAYLTLRASQIEAAIQHAREVAAAALDSGDSARKRYVEARLRALPSRLTACVAILPTS